jgi:hypothetical protein
MPVGLLRLFSPQASLAGVGGGKPPTPAEIDAVTIAADRTLTLTDSGGLNS